MARNTRPFSTATSAPHPMPALPRIPRKFLAPLAATAALGFAAHQYSTMKSERQAHLDRMHAEECERNARFIDAYGDRSDLAALERAMAAYNERK